MRLLLATFVGRLVSFLSRLFGLGFGYTWSGHVALKIYPDLISKLESQLKMGSVTVAGTNGKTTTCKMIREILEAEGLKVIHNSTGANLLNGVAGALISNGKGQIGVFELDENVLPLALEKFTPEVVVLLNLFRDQLDRYAELELTAKKWERTLQTLPKETVVVLNADDPLIANLGKSLKCVVVYFGFDDDGNGDPTEVSDSEHCPQCNTTLDYSRRFYSHIGNWACPQCGNTRPNLDYAGKHITKTGSGFEFQVGEHGITIPLAGLYSVHNTLAGWVVASVLKIDLDKARQAIQAFTPAFGRQETFIVNNKKVKILLSKNPTGMNENLKTVVGTEGPLLFMLNNYIPDGRDTSWVWDISKTLLKSAVENREVFVSGVRAEDMAIRINYAVGKQDFVKQENVSSDLKKMLNKAVEATKENETLQILPTYSAMLEVRKLLV